MQEKEIKEQAKKIVEEHMKNPENTVKTMKKKIGIRFVEKGANVVMKQNHPDFVMNSREVMIQIDQLENAVSKGGVQLEQMKTQRMQIEEAIKNNEERLKDIKKFEPKMREYQESKAKAIFNDIKKECFEKVEKDYTTDDALTDDMNNKQKWRIYQNAIATHKRVAEELAPKIMQKMYFKENILDNPWK